MVCYGSAEAAASAAVKLFCGICYGWEERTYDFVPRFQEEEPENLNFIAETIRERRERIDLRTEEWVKMIPHEILANNASHPTVKMRLEAMGITDPVILPRETDSQYSWECQKAVKFLDALNEPVIHKNYKEFHEEYVKSMKNIDEWKEAGEPLIPEKYRDIVADLRYLGKIAEADALCLRAIRELSDSAAAYAEYIHGSLLLHQMNPEGLEHVYRSFINQNYWEEGLDTIGLFCCLTGNEEELKKYREKTADMLQELIDNDVNSLSSRDRLEPETLPEGKKEQILKVMLSAGKEWICQVYLCRKVFSEEAFSSVFVIRFIDSCTEENKYEVMHQVFMYLDTESNWQYSLFDYDDVNKVGFQKIEGSLIYQKED